MAQLQTVTIKEGVVSDVPLTLLGNGVTVDNLSASWIQLPDANRFVPPFTHGFTTSLLAATQQLRVNWYTPNGIMSPTAGQGTATMTVSTQALPFNPGVVVVQATPTGSATPSQTHVIVDSGTITPVQPVQVTISGQPIATSSATVNSQVVQFASSVNANSSATVVAGVGGKVVTIQGGFMGVSLSTTGANAGSLQTSGGTVLCRVRTDTIVTTAVGELYIPPVIYPLSDLSGVPIASGQGLVVTNDAGSAGALYFSGYLLYTQV